MENDEQRRRVVEAGLKALFLTDKFCRTNWDENMRIDVLASRENSTVFRMVAPEQWGNNYRKMHGGAYGAVADCLTSVAGLAARMQPSVSVALTLNYGSAADIGDTIFMECRVERSTRTLLFMSFKFYVVENGKERVLVSGNHTKHYITAQLPGDGTKTWTKLLTNPSGDDHTNTNAKDEARPAMASKL
mmetsp:Transcript_3526/g.12694  ORF Transcript_3526/g.12694 Transcript_3526/m.12694 type:complete len:189 (+) Transcript_3526:158-724(+)